MEQEGGAAKKKWKIIHKCHLFTLPQILKLTLNIYIEVPEGPKVYPPNATHKTLNDMNAPNLQVVSSFATCNKLCVLV